MAKIDYKELLGKYVDVVVESEGTDFLSISEFTTDEIVLINEAYEEYFNITFGQGASSR